MVAAAAPAQPVVVTALATQCTRQSEGSESGSGEFATTTTSAVTRYMPAGTRLVVIADSSIRRPHSQLGVRSSAPCCHESSRRLQECYLDGGRSVAGNRGRGVRGSPDGMGQSQLNPSYTPNEGGLRWRTLYMRKQAI